MCYQTFLIQNCGCYAVGYGPSPQNVRPCVNETDQRCFNHVLEEFTRSRAINFCDCPVPCFDTIFHATASLANFPSRAYAEFLVSDPAFTAIYPNDTEPSYELIAKRVAAVNIYFNELSETSITESKKMQIQDIISNVGGILGVFLGKNFSLNLHFIKFPRRFYFFFALK